MSPSSSQRASAGKRTAPRATPLDPSSGVLARIGAPSDGQGGVSNPRRSTRKGRTPRIASLVDRHRLYELSVQSVDAEIDFVDDTYKALRGRRAKWLREDFCGTANTSCEWVRRRPSNHAVGVDLDPSVLAWGSKNKVGRLRPAQRKRIALRNEDVLTVQTHAMDVILAMNFSYWLFLTRDEMRRYFRSVREHLAKDGVFFLDSYGGYEAGREMREPREIKARGPWGKRFTYIWDQHKFDPITGRMDCRIHFRFDDGSRLTDAFTYHWRLWTLPEIKELLLEAGFSRATIYWEGTDEKTGEGNGDFQPAERGEADAAFIVYIVAEK